MLNLAEEQLFIWSGLLKSVFIGCIELNIERSIDKLHRTGKYDHTTKTQPVIV